MFNKAARGAPLLLLAPAFAQAQEANADQDKYFDSGNAHAFIIGSAVFSILWGLINVFQVSFWSSESSLMS